MHNVFQRFVDRLAAKPDPSMLADVLSETLTVLDLTSFAYLLLPTEPEEAARLVSNYPAAWTEHYMANGYSSIDPVILQARKIPRSFTWGPEADLHLRPESQIEFFEEAAGFGIRSGFTLPIHDGPRYVAALTLSVDARQRTLDSIVERYEPTLQLVATLFHRSARRVLIADRIVDGVALSPREYECLDWSAKGKTAWEISVILGISRRTVAYHIENAKAKLGVHAISEAVARFAASGATNV